MESYLTPKDIQRLAKARGLTIKQVCCIAKIAQSTFHRWKRGANELNTSSYRRICNAILPQPPVIEKAPTRRSKAKASAKAAPAIAAIPETHTSGATP